MDVITPTTRLPIVGVMGSGSIPHEERAQAVGKWLAEQNVHLLTGGGGGVMESVSKAFYNARPRKGLVLGILPGMERTSGYQPVSGYPNQWVEVPIYTHLPLSGERGTESMSRNHINILSSDVITALPGSKGTASEIALAQHYGRPLVAFLKNRNEIEDLPEKTLIETDFENVKKFVLKALSSFR